MHFSMVANTLNHNIQCILANDTYILAREPLLYLLSLLYSGAPKRFTTLGAPLYMF